MTEYLEQNYRNCEVSILLLGRDKAATTPTDSLVLPIANLHPSTRALFEHVQNTMNTIRAIHTKDPKDPDASNRYEVLQKALVRSFGGKQSEQIVHLWKTYNEQNPTPVTAPKKGGWFGRKESDDLDLLLTAKALGKDGSLAFWVHRALKKSKAARYTEDIVVEMVIEIICGHSAWSGPLQHAYNNIHPKPTKRNDTLLQDVKSFNKKRSSLKELRDPLISVVLLPVQGGEMTVDEFYQACEPIINEQSTHEQELEFGQKIFKVSPSVHRDILRRLPGKPFLDPLIGAFHLRGHGTKTFTSRSLWFQFYVCISFSKHCLWHL
jgi:hypothetical protein